MPVKIWGLVLASARCQIPKNGTNKLAKANIAKDFFICPFSHPYGLGLSKITPSKVAI
jgi:hypothetical protein